MPAAHAIGPPPRADHRERAQLRPQLERVALAPAAAAAKGVGRALQQRGALLRLERLVGERRVGVLEGVELLAVDLVQVGAELLPVGARQRRLAWHEALQQPQPPDGVLLERREQKGLLAREALDGERLPQRRAIARAPRRAARRRRESANHTSGGRSSDCAGGDR